MNILIYFGPQLNPQRGGTERVACMIADFFISQGDHVSYMASIPVDDELSRESVFLPDGDDKATDANIAFVKSYVHHHKIELIINEGASTDAVFLFSHEHIPHTVKIISHLHFSVLDDIVNFYKTLNYPLAHVPLTQFCLNLLKWIKSPYNKRKALHNKRQRYNYMCEHSDYVVVLSDNQKSSLESLLRVGPLEKVVAIQNPIQIASSFTSDVQKENLILFVGRLDYSSKRVDRVLRVWSLLQHDLPDWRLMVIGSGSDMPRLVQMSKDLRLQRMEFAGQTDPVPYYERAKLLLMTSNYEGTPMVIIEAMAFGVVPVVMNTFKDAGLVIKDAENGLLTAPFDLRAMAEGVVRLAEDAALLEQMSRNAKSTIGQLDNYERLKLWKVLADGK